MSSSYAFVTLLSSDSYLPGALVLAASLRDVHPYPPVEPEVAFKTICLVTPESVDVQSIKALRKAFDVVVGVEILEGDNAQGLHLLGRPDLSTVLTKLHAFRLVEYDKLIFLDADVLPLRPLSHLFSLPHEFSAAPDVGWPDIFNSGVFVFTPGEDKFQELQALARSKGSWDGGDQGLLNEWRGNNWNRLSFTYNTTPTSAYTYAPAFVRFGADIKAIHFIGHNKPWSSIPWRAPIDLPSEESMHSYGYGALVDRWYAVYDRHYRPPIPATEEEYRIQIYGAAWDTAAFDPTAYSAPQLPGGFGLEELKRIAVEGVHALGGKVAGVKGEYKSLPLEGRVDLLRPQKERPPDAEPTQYHDDHYAAASNVASPQWETEPRPPGREGLPPHLYRTSQHHHAPAFPGYHAASAAHHHSSPSNHEQTHTQRPKSPHSPRLSHRSRSQSRSPLHHIESEQAYISGTQPSVHQEEGIGHTPSAVEQRSQERHHHRDVEEEYHRPLSPPLFIWNPAHDPPPQDPPPLAAFDAQPAYYPNAWDKPASTRRRVLSTQAHIPTLPGSHSHSHHHTRSYPYPFHQQSYSKPQHQHQHPHSSSHSQHSQPWNSQLQPLTDATDFSVLRQPNCQAAHWPPLAPSADTLPRHATPPREATRATRVFRPYTAYPPVPQNETQMTATWPPQHANSPHRRASNGARDEPNPTNHSNHHSLHPFSASYPDPNPTAQYWNNYHQNHSTYSLTQEDASPDLQDDRPEAFFHAPPPPPIPQHLAKDEYYAKLIAQSSQPEEIKVTPVFPWEETARTRPSRVFPEWERKPPRLNNVAERVSSPSLAFAAAPLPQKTTVGISPPEPLLLGRSSSPAAHVIAPQRTFQSPPERPLQGHSSSAFANAWDEDPAIQRYASSLSAGRSVFPGPAPWPTSQGQIDYFSKSSKHKGKGRRGSSSKTDDEEEEFTNWADRAEASSRDGDDEDDEIEEVTSPKGTSRSKRKDGTYIKGNGYRSIGVQTDAKETKDAAIQVSMASPPINFTSNGNHPVTVLPGIKRRHSNARVPQAVAKINGKPEDASSRDAEVDAVNGTISPRLQESSAYAPYQRSPLATSFKPGKRERHGATSPPKAVPPPRQRVSSGDTVTTATTAPDSSLLASPRSDFGDTTPPASIPEEPEDAKTPPVIQFRVHEPSPDTTPQGTSGARSPLGGSLRRAARVFDPARGVDILKKSSEEVLARFLRQGASGWGDRVQTAEGPATPSAVT